MSLLSRVVFRVRSSVALTRCHNAIRLLQPYLDGTLDADAAARLERHLADCPPCVQEAEVHTRIREALERRGQAASPQAVARLEEFARSIESSHEQPER